MSQHVIIGPAFLIPARDRSKISRKDVVAR